jgi:hypothetical protein
MLSVETVVVWLVLTVAAAVGGWLASGSSHRRRFVQWQVTYQNRLQAVFQREAGKGRAEITKLKSEMVKLKAENWMLLRRHRVEELKRPVEAPPRLTQLVQPVRLVRPLRPVQPARPLGDGFADTQPFEDQA